MLGNILRYEATMSLTGLSEKREKSVLFLCAITLPHTPQYISPHAQITNEDASHTVSTTKASVTWIWPSKPGNLL